ncbi:hypothetical protein AB0L40_05505 [Patulibacter sp. NPDC049589]|uniref:hypothetical protein n=1 Tax=Patulibacter sp. NPDC049589 TaxID=3154731 RepID=UPI00341B7DB3
MNEIDELERQLRRGVRALAPKPRRSRRLRLLGVALPVVAIAGVAGAAGLVDHPTANKRADVLVRRITADTASDPACARTLPGRGRTRTTSDARPLPEIVRILPTMGDPAASSPPERLVRRVQRGTSGGVVMRRTVRLARFPDGTEVYVFVTIGGSTGLTVADPAGCRKARLHALAGMKDVDEAVRDRAREVFTVRPDTDPRAQTLVMQSSDGGGSAQPVQPGHPLSTRRYFSVGSSFTGIAQRRAVAIEVQRLRPGKAKRVWRGEGAYAARIPVRYGVYGFKGRGGTDARYRIVQYDAAGKVVRRVILPQ